MAGVMRTSVSASAIHPLDRGLPQKSRIAAGEANTAAFALLFSEVVQYVHRSAKTVTDLEAGYAPYKRDLM